MVAIIIAAVIVLLISLARDLTCSTSSRDSVRSNDDIGMLREILQRMDKMQNYMVNIQTHIDRIEKYMDIRFDKIEANDRNMHDNTKNLSFVMETIVEQQMVITAEIFTVSQTLPFCCCQYRNTTDHPEIEATTIDTGKPETTTPTNLTSLPTNCDEAMGERGRDGIYQINLTDSNIGPFDVYCTKNVVDGENERVINGIWMIVQRRQDNITNFHQNWNMYQRGFGELIESFWIGFDKLYALTKAAEQELWVQLENQEGSTSWIKYSYFSIGSESEKYKLKTLGVYVGTAKESLLYHKNQKWTTFDQDNDNAYGYNCAVMFPGAWWFNDCIESHLNGIYNTGIRWKLEHSFKYVHMAIRPRK